MKAKHWVTIVAIVALVFIESLALYYHVDGQVLSLVVAAIAGLAGYRLGVSNSAVR
jgi:hypothetical protein